MQHSDQLQERILKDEADNKVQKGTAVKFLLSHKFDKSVVRRWFSFYSSGNYEVSLILKKDFTGRLRNPRLERKIKDGTKSDFLWFVVVCLRKLSVDLRCSHLRKLFFSCGVSVHFEMLIDFSIQLKICF